MVEFLDDTDAKLSGDEDLSPQASRQRQRRDGPRKPRTWVQVDEFGEPVALSAEQMLKLRSRAENLCLWHLGQGPRTHKQLADAMSKKGVPADMADSILEKLADYNYVNDAEFAENYVRSRHEHQRKAGSAIRYELIRKGVDAETISVALEQVSPESERENARALVERKLRSTVGLERQKRVNRLVGMLARKGYPAGMAFEVVRLALEDEPTDETNEA